MEEDPEEGGGGGDSSSSCDVVEEHVLLELEGHPALLKGLAFDSETLTLTGMNGEADGEVTLRVAGSIFRGSNEAAMLGTALVFGKHQEAPVCVTRRIVLRSAKMAKTKPPATSKAVPKKTKRGRRKRRAVDDDDDDYDE